MGSRFCPAKRRHPVQHLETIRHLGLTAIGARITWNRWSQKVKVKPKKKNGGQDNSIESKPPHLDDNMFIDHVVECVRLLLHINDHIPLDMELREKTDDERDTMLCNGGIDSCLRSVVLDAYRDSGACLDTIDRLIRYQFPKVRAAIASLQGAQNVHSLEAQHFPGCHCGRAQAAVGTSQHSQPRYFSPGYFPSQLQFRGQSYPANVDKSFHNNTLFHHGPQNGGLSGLSHGAPGTSSVASGASRHTVNPASNQHATPMASPQPSRNQGPGAAATQASSFVDSRVSERPYPRGENLVLFFMADWPLLGRDGDPMLVSGRRTRQLLRQLRGLPPESEAPTGGSRPTGRMERNAAIARMWDRSPSSSLPLAHVTRSRWVTWMDKNEIAIW